MARHHEGAALSLSGRRLLIERVLEKHWTVSAAAEAAGVSRRTAHKWIGRFQREGTDGLKDRSSRPHRTRQINAPAGPALQQQVLALLHSPPTNHGFTRTTWRLTDLKSALAAAGTITSKTNVSAVIRSAGYRYKKARVSLTSSDPEYRSKVDAIKATLASLGPDEAFFSIDEFGPFAVRMKGGRSLQPQGTTRVVPQWQPSKGSLILSAALELSSNQVTHFFSERKNTDETIALIEQVRRRYRGLSRIYLSWDAAPWHESKALLERIAFLNEWAEHDGAALIELRPLPSSSQFLNVIEAVFSGMARSILHNSNFGGVEEAQRAITTYLEARNAAFLQTPKRAGRTLWGSEPEQTRFNEANVCKDSRYR